MKILSTVGEDEIVMETPAERFESCVLNKEPFMPDTAIYFLNLKNDSIETPNLFLTNALQQSKGCYVDADMMKDEEMDAAQSWEVLCTPEAGKNFARSFVIFADNEKNIQKEKKFDNLVICLDKTNAIINSVLNPNGTQHT